MLVYQFDVGWAARGCHEWLSLFQLFFQFGSFVAYGIHGSLSYFDHIGKSHLAECTVYCIDRCVELSENGRSGNRNHFFTAADTFEHIKGL